MEWISVKDRLPRPYVDTVLVARDINSGCPAVMPAIHNEEAFLAISLSGIQEFVEPTHWMLLPEPPREPTK